MSLKTNTVNEKTKKFDECVKELHEIVSDSDIIPQQFQITLQELTDEYTDYVASLSEIFIETGRRRGISRADTFTKIPIVNSIENYPYPIVLLSDEQELDAETQNIVRRRSENGYVTFPVIILSDQFFRLTYGESFSYKNIIETFEESSKEKVMVFRRSEFNYFEEYMIAVRHLCQIYAYRQVIEEIRTELLSVIRDESEKLEKTASTSSLIVMQHIKAIVQVDTELERSDKNFERRIIEWQAEITSIREKYDKLVLEEITHIDVNNISPFVLDIDLKYGVLQGYIKDFLNLREIELDYDFITEDLKRLVEETRISVKSNKANLSLIGTFSSGKTTLINTFLGEREIPLRTSMKHNTAVLMHLFHYNQGSDYYDIIYKDKLIWTVVKPATMTKFAVNTANENIRILNVAQGEKGIYRIDYYLTQSKVQRSVTIRSSADIAVKKGDVLKPGEHFTTAEKKVSANVEICSKAEIELLIKQVGSSKECQLQTAADSTKEQSKILGMLKQIYKIASETRTTKPYDKFCEEIGIKPSASNNIIGQGKPSYPEKFRRIEVSCNLDKKNEKRTLDRRGWLELCGDPDPKKISSSSAFSEMPECYMLAKELQLHIDAEFLQYCSLTDTPGFGSVTEEHDAITERYIRDSSGRLLVMIAINAKTIDAKYMDLINSIDDIYNNFRKADKKNVVFILNCFTNSTTEENIKNQIEKVYRMLDRYGFNKNNVFVCNLKSALVDKQQMDTMYGHPSYKQFHEFIIKGMISADLDKKYRGIQSNWKLFFSDSQRRLEEQIYDLESNLNNLQQYKQQLKDTIDALRKISVDKKHYDKDSVKEEFDSMYEILEDAYLHNWKITGKRRKALKEGHKTVEAALSVCNEDLRETIYDYYTNLINQISYQGNSEKSPPKLPSTNSTAVLETERLYRLLMEADDETSHAFNKSKQYGYAEKISDLIQSGYEQTVDKANSLCSDCAKIVKEFKESIIREKESALNAITNEQTMKEQLSKLRTINENMGELERRFNRIKFV